MLNGRQLIFMLIEHLKTNDSCRALNCTIRELSDVLWLGDTPGQMQRFYDVWVDVAGSQGSDVSEATLKEMLLVQLKSLRRYAPISITTDALKAPQTTRTCMYWATLSDDWRKAGATRIICKSKERCNNG